MTSRRDERIADLTRRGYTAAKIAQIEGVTTRSVARARVRTGVAKPPNRILTAVDLAHAEALLEDGASYVEAARTLGCSFETLRKHFPGRGWDAHTVAQYSALCRANRTALA